MTDAKNEADSGASLSDAVLERCPFCGGAAAFGTVTYQAKSEIARMNGQTVFHSVNCIECGSSNRGLIGYLSASDASEHWNKRSNA